MKIKNREVLSKIRNYPTVDTLQSGDTFRFIAGNPGKLYIYNSLQKTATDIETGETFFSNGGIGSISDWTEAPIEEIKVTVVIDTHNGYNYNIDPEEEPEEKEEPEPEPEKRREGAVSLENSEVEMEDPWERNKLPFVYKMVNGNNLIPIIDEFAESLGIEPGDIVKMELEEEAIIVTKSNHV